MTDLFIFASAAAELAENVLPLGITEGGSWLLRNAWLIPLIPALSFVGILFFGKRMPRQGAELGVAAIGIAFVLAVLTGAAWMDHRDNYHGEEITQAVIVAEHGDAADHGEGHAPEHPSLAVSNTVTWFQVGGMTISVGVLVDGLAVMMLFVVTLVSLLVHIYSTDYVGGDRRYTH